MAKNNAIVLGIVVVVVVAAAAAYFIINDNNNDDKAKTPTMGVGDSMTFLVFGTYEDSGVLIDGTMTMKILDENDTQYKVETETAIYTVDSTGKQTPMHVGKDTDWEDKDDDVDYVDNGKLTVSTFWGEKTLQYMKSEDGNTHILCDGDIAYAMMVESSDSTVYFELSDCTLIKEKKVSREVHDAIITMDMEMEYEGTMIVGNLIYEANNTETEIFMQYSMGLIAYAENDPTSRVIRSVTQWTDPFDESGYVKVGTERISTAWGYKDTDIYMQSEGGSTVSMYQYKSVPVRMVLEENGLKMTFDASSIIVDGKSVTLDETAAL